MSFYEERGYLCADGKAMKTPDKHPCQKKLCFAATDKAYLVSVLEHLLERDDCYWVKYSPTARDGMHLGRAFMTSPNVVGSLRAEFKRDPKLLCSIQDDDFVDAFRAAT